MPETEDAAGEPTRKKKRPLRDHALGDPAAESSSDAESEEEEESVSRETSPGGEGRAVAGLPSSGGRGVAARSTEPETPAKPPEAAPGWAERFRFERRTPRRRRP